MGLDKITYASGQFCQFKLADGKRLYLETLPEKVRIKKIILGLVPTKKVWEFNFSFYIRTVGEAWDLSKEILDLVLDSIDNCKTFDELQRRLNNETTTLLNQYIQENKLRVYRIGVEKLGRFAVKKYLDSSPLARDAAKIPLEVANIVGNYGKVLEESSNLGNLLHPLSKLPYPKEKIENALKTALGCVTDEYLSKAYQVALFSLEDFIPDDEVPKNREENKRAWMARRFPKV